MKRITKDEGLQNSPTITKPKLPAELNGYYIIVGEKGNVHYHTLSSQRKTCIEKFLEGGMLTWKHCRELGWRCLKVDVSFKPCR